MKTRFKKITSVFLSFLMVVYLFPFGAFAEAATVNTETTEEYTVYRYQDQTCAFTLESWAAGEEKTITDEYQGASFNYYLAVQDSVGNICMDELSASGENISADWIYSDDEKIGAVVTITAAGNSKLDILNSGEVMTTINFSVSEAATVVASGDCGENVTYKLDSNGVLTISGTGEMTDFESSSETPWYSNNHKVKTIVIEAGVTSIGDYAFTGTYAQSVSIAETVVFIGYAAFKETLLTEVEIPDSVTIISDFAFAKCESLVTAYLSEYISSIYSSTFVGCTMLESIAVPVGVTSIGSNAFSGCTALKTVSIPDTVTKIDSGAFFYCEADIYYSSTKSAWNTIAGLADADLDSCTIVYGAFDITVGEVSDGTVTVDKAVARAEETVTVTATPAENYTLSAILVDGNVIEGNTFTVTGDHTVTATFEENVVTYPITVGTVHNGTVTVDKETASADETVTVTATPDEGFELQGIYVNGYAVTGNTFNPYAESTVTALFRETATGLVIVDTGSCGENAVWTLYDTNADGKGDHVVISGSGDMSSGTPTKAYLDNIKTVVVEDGITSIGNNAFNSHKYITQVTLPDTVVSIGEQSFYKCLSLTTINFPAGLTSVGKRAFHTCKITQIPENLESADDYAFYGCKFTELTIPESLTTIGEFVFENCTELTTVTIPDSFTTLGNGMFSLCTKLVNVTLPSKLTAVPKALFSGCTKLTEMTIPEGVTSIGSSAFNMCSSLVSVTIPESVTTIEDYAFDGCSVLANVYYGGSPSGWSAVSIADANRPLINATVNYAKEDVVTYSITVGEAENGTVTVDKETAQADETVTVTATPAEGYTLSAILVDGTAIEGNTFTVTGDHTVTATFTAVVVEPELTETQTGSCGDNLTYTLTTDGTLTISGEGAVTTAPWLTYKSFIKALVLEEGVTSVCAGAFADCVNMESVTFSKTFYMVEENAFLNCTSLSTLYYTGLSTDIQNTQFEFAETGNEAFLTLQPIPTVAVAGGSYGSSLLWDVTTDGRLIISGTGRAEYPEAIYDDNNNVIGATTPWDAYDEDITKIIVEEGVEGIPSYLFAGLVNAKEFTFPQSCEFIFSYAFANTGVEKVYFTGTAPYAGFSVETYGNEAIYNADFEFVDKTVELSGQCGENLTWTFTADDATLTISGTGDMYSFDDPYIGPVSEEEESHDVPWWNIRMFIKNVELEDGITSIGKGAFLSAWDLGVLPYGLTSITIPSTVVSIGEYAFRGQTTVEQITIPDSVKEISYGAFSDCTSLTEIKLPADIEVVYSDTFGACTSLKTVYMDTKVTRIESAFSGCDAMETIVYNGTERQWNLIDIEDSYINDGLISVRFNDGIVEYAITVDAAENGTVTVDKEYAQEGETVTVTATPDDGYFLSAILVDNIAIEGNTFTVTADHTVTAQFTADEPELTETQTGSCGEAAEYTLTTDGILTISGIGDITTAPWLTYKSSITEVIIEKGITGICEGAFSGCKNLKSFTMTQDVVYIGANAFLDTAVENITFTGPVAAIMYGIGERDYATEGNEAFYAVQPQFADSLNTAENNGIISELLKDGTLFIMTDDSGSTIAVEDCGFEQENGCIDGIPVKSIVFDHSVGEIYADAFYGFEYLEEVHLGYNLSYITEYAFEECNSIKRVYSPWSERGFKEYITIEEHNDSIIKAQYIPEPLMEDWDICGDNLKWVLMSDGIVTITGTGDMYNYIDPTESEEENWSPFAMYANIIEKVIISEGVTSIGDNAFLYLYPEVIEAEFSLPDTLKHIGAKAFAYHPGFKTMEIPSGVETIGEKAFTGCINLTEITIPQSVTTIETDTFADCINLEKVTIPATVTLIKEAAFDGCKNLTDVYYDGTKAQFLAIEVREGNEIFETAVIHCTDTIYDHISVRGECGDSITWTISEKDVLTISGTGAVGSAPWLEYKDSIAEVVIESGITSICAEAFKDCTYLSKVSYTSTLAEIGENAFSGCTALSQRCYHDRVTYHQEEIAIAQGNELFENLEEVNTLCEAGGNITNLYWDLYWDGTLYVYGRGNWWHVDNKTGGPWNDCETVVKSLVLEFGVNGITSEGLIGLTELEEITIPLAAWYFESDTFADCSKLRTVYFHGTERAWSALEIGSGNQNLFNARVIYITDIIETSGECGAENADDIQWTLSSGGVLSFTGTGAMEDFKDPHTNVNSLNDRYSARVAPWWDYYSYIEEIVVGEGITTVGHFAFTSCGGVYDYIYNKVTLPSTLKSIGGYAFLDTVTLKEIDIPDSVEYIYDGAFSGTKIEKVELPANIIRIYDSAFYDCSQLTNVTIPASVKIIEQYAFDKCWMLDVAEYEGTREQWDDVVLGKNAFKYNTSIHCTDDPEIYTILVERPKYGYLSVEKSRAMAGERVAILYEANEELGTALRCYRVDGEIITGNSFTVTGNHTISADIYDDTYTTVESGSLGSMNWEIDSEGVLTIFGSGRMDDFAVPGSAEGTSPWAEHYDKFNFVSIVDDSVPNIGANAFYGHTDLEHIAFTGTMMEVGENAFYGCDNLKKVLYSYTPEIYANLTVAQGNENLLNAEVEYINCEGQGMCGDTAGFTLSLDGTLTIYPVYGGMIPNEYDGYEEVGMMDDYEHPDNNGIVPPWSKYYTDITKVVIEAGVDNIGEYAFTNNTTIKEVYIEGGLNYIEQYAFDGCTSITDVYFDGTVGQWRDMSIQYPNDPINNANIHILGTNIFTEECGYGYIWVYPEYVEEGESKEITVEYEPYEGYRLDTVYVDGVAIEGTTFTATGSCTVSATFVPKEYTVTLIQPEHGTISVESTTVLYDSDFEVTATPDPGYELSEIIVEGNGGVYDTNRVYAYSDLTITAVFVPAQYDITAEEAENGTVSVDKTSAAYGETVTVTATPNEHYTVETILVDGTPIEGDIFTVTGDHTVSAAFVPVEYTITAEDGENGTVSVDKQTAIFGETVTVTATANEHYTVETIFVDGTPIEGDTFTVTADHTVSATFVPIEYTGAVEDGENGNVSIDKDKATAGETVTVTATPDEHYVVGKIIVNGVEISGNTFIVTGDYTIVVIFVPIEYTGTVEEAENGNVSIDKDKATVGETVTVTATPDEHYVVDKIIVNGGEIRGNTFIVTGDYTIVVVFRPIVYTITAEEAENGNVSIDKDKATAGETVTVTATPDEHYVVDKIIVNGVEITGNTFIVTGDYTIVVVFRPIVYTITVEDAENGTVSVDRQTATAGETVTVTTTPDTGYKLVEILVDGVAIEGNTFTVTGNHTVTAQFKSQEFDIAVEVIGEGEVVLDKDAASIGDTVTVTATPDENYTLAQILVDGVEISGNTFTTTGAHTVTVVFAVIPAEIPLVEISLVDGKPCISWADTTGAVRYQVYRSATGEENTFVRIATTTANSYTNTSAKAGTEYFYKVRAVAADGTPGEYSDIMTIITAPESPMPSISLSNGKPKLTWDAVTGAAKYKVYRSTTGKAGSFTVIKTTTSTSFTNTGASMGTEYFYKVRALNADGVAGELSDIVSIITAPDCPIVEATLNSGRPKLTWEAVTGAVRYQIFRSESGEEDTFTRIRTTSALYLNDTTAKPGTEYFYMVKAVTADGTESDYSDVVSIITKPDTPMPSIALSSGKPKITWDAVTGAAKYQVYRSTTGKAGSFTVIKTTTSTSFINTGAAFGTEYFYKVKAVTADGTASELSDIVSIITKPDIPAFEITLSGGKPKITWDAVTGAAKYQVYRSTTGEVGTFTRIYTLKGTSYTNTNAAYGTTYYYKVRAINADGTAGDLSDPQSIMTAPDTPVVDISLSSGKPKLTWDAVTGAAKYKVYRSTTGKAGSFTVIKTTTSTSFINTGATAATTYYYKVCAVTEDGTSGTLSDPVSITTT